MKHYFHLQVKGVSPALRRDCLSEDEIREIRLRKISFFFTLTAITADRGGRAV